jgi:S1-C subfamily serine protease
MLAVSIANTPLNSAEQQAWRKLQPSLVTLLSGNHPSGTAALIDPKGLFLAHFSMLEAKAVDGRLSNGQTIRLQLVALDEPTQLALLEAQDWVRFASSRSEDDVKTSGLKAVAVGGQPSATWSAITVVSKLSSGTPLLAALPNGPVRAQFVSSDRFGVMTSSRRFMQLSEVRFEASPQLIGGAMVFARTGELVGVVNAALDLKPTLAKDLVAQEYVAQSQASQAQAVRGSKSQGDPAKVAELSGQFFSQARQYGPGPMTVAYTVSPVVLRRVIAGFKSPTRTVIHPNVGLYCLDAPTGGAQVDSIRKGSTAEMAGIRRGDVIVEIAGSPIRNQFAFAKALASREYGDRLRFKVRRGGALISIDVVVGQ